MSDDKQFRANRELVLVVDSQTDIGDLQPLSAMPPGTAASEASDTVGNVLARYSATLESVFDEIATEVAMPSAAGTDAHAAGAGDKYFTIGASDDVLDQIASEMRELPVVRAAYVKPSVEPPLDSSLNVPGAAVLPSGLQTPLYEADQSYLNAAPVGVNARYGWSFPGGLGSGVRVIDIEGAWRFSHEDLLQNQGGVVGGTPLSDLGWRNHGTAVVGVIGADQGPKGVTGIVPEAHVSAVSFSGHALQPGQSGTAKAIDVASQKLRAGDILLIELHRPGPTTKFMRDDNQVGYIGIEWWPDDFEAIKRAVARGVIVVEAAGNGGQNLQDTLHDTRPAEFPSGWTNPFQRSPDDSGAVLVGAGAPPPGTHGNDHGPDRSRLGFSNYGSCIDAQGWGREVTTTGYGDLQGGSTEDRWYTTAFSGTSSASPIVVGAVASVQGVLKRYGRSMTPAECRNLLRTTGSAQQDAPGRPVSQHIGTRPDIKAMLRLLIGVG